MGVALRTPMQDTHHEDAERLHSGAPYWLVKNGIRDDGVPLDGVVTCDVVVIGAGITGALIADALSAQGIEVVVLDRNEPGTGSTGASTALVLYEPDAELVELADLMGTEDAVQVYRLCLGAVQGLTQTALSLGGCGLAMKDGLYLASRPANAARLEREAAMRQSHRLPATFLDRGQVDARYGIPSHGAIVSGPAAQVDPLRLTLALLHRATRRGTRLFTRTTALGMEPQARGVVVHTARGGKVRARRAVYAMGYELPPSLEPNIMSLHSTYALATHRLDGLPAWVDRTLLWETARPYAYMRTTGDGRLLIGGEDVPFKSAALRDRLLPSRIARLERRLETLIPGIKARAAFAWAGTFGETPDCLPYIGAHPHFPGAWFALGYGGNGITYSILAARLICDELLERPNGAARLFSPTREVRRRGTKPPCGASGVVGDITRALGIGS
jgi:glycine/D-amino acid oxidase-like deaminating enzyme